MIDTVAFIDAARTLYPQLVHLQDYFLVDRGEDGIDVQGWPDGLPQPSNDQIKQARTALDLTASKLELANRNTEAALQIARIQDRVDAINDATDGGYVLPAETAELPGRVTQLAAWKKYRVLVGRVSTQATWPASPVWPAQPDVYTDETSAIAPAAV